MSSRLLYYIGMHEQQVNTAPAIITGVYWRNGLATVPAILRLDGEILTLKTTKRIVWQTDIAATTCRFSSFGTMLIKVGTTEYAIVTTGAAVSKPFSEAQQQELGIEAAVQVAKTDAKTSLGAAGVASGTALGAAGAPLMLHEQVIGANRLSIWRDEYKRRQLLTADDGDKAARNLLLMLVGGIIVGIVLVIVFKVFLRVG